VAHAGTSSCTGQYQLPRPQSVYSICMSGRCVDLFDVHQNDAAENSINMWKRTLMCCMS
jgi:hypothetical protein